MNMKSTRKAYLFALLAVLFWSTIPTVFKLGLAHTSSWQLLTGATLVSTLVLGILTMARGKFRSLRDYSKKDLAFSALMGLLNPVIYYLVLFKAYTILPASVAQPLNMIWPIALVLLAVPILRQRISWLSLGAMLLSFSGVVLISLMGGTGSENPQNRLGIFLALSTSVVWALYFLYNTRDKEDPVARLFLNFAFASLFPPAGWNFQGPKRPQLCRRVVCSPLCGSFRNGYYLCPLVNGHSTSAKERPDQQPGIYSPISEPVVCQSGAGRKNLHDHRRWYHLAGGRHCDPEYNRKKCKAALKKSSLELTPEPP